MIRPLLPRRFTLPGSGSGSRPVQRWADYRRQQRDTWRASNRLAEARDPTRTQSAAPASGDGPSPEPGQTATTESSGYGAIGRPLNRQSPFYLGFVGAIGALVAYGLVHTITRLITTLTLLVVAIFLALALNPLVESLTGRGIKRTWAVALVFAGLIAVFTAISMLVVPPIVQQSTELGQHAPDYVDRILGSNLVQRLDRNYQLSDTIQEELRKRVTDGDFVGKLFGGVLGAGKAVASGLFAMVTVFILTLYFLASLPRVKQAAYGMVPLSRRPRFVSLSEEVLRRVGSYAIGQVAVATINALLSWVMMTILGIPYAAVLAVVVGVLGIIPMVGATLGALVVVTVAFFDDPKTAIIVAVYYVVYQQIENYVVAPRIMQRTVSVPGAVTVVAALAGGTLLGVLGALLAIPVAAGLLLIYNEVLLPRQRRA